MDEQTIFSQALAIESDAERSKFLDSACGDDRELRARIERLLRLQEDAGSFLEKTPDELVALAETKADESESESADRWKESLEPSDDPNSLGRLGPYEIAELIGRGGMGVVLRAFDSKLKRTVAIKILAPEFTANPMAVRRFLREASSAAAVSHDHVVTIHAIDEETQPPRIVMECVDGQSLQQKIDNEGALELKSILRIGMQTAAGLSAAHKQGLVHRDIKPSNILLENGIERVKLTDFGLARAVDDIGVTRTGQITGTPQYMSPEQAQGHRVDHRTDLFSLGCVLYAMCTGRAAFRADSAVAVMHRVVHDTPKPIREANEEIPEWLCEIVDKLLEKNPEDRFASAREVEELLGQHLAHLQQPQSVPRPKSLGPPVSRLGRQIDEDLSSAARIFLGTGMACLIFFVLTFLGLSNDWLRNWNQGFVIVLLIGGLISLPVGLLAMNAHFDVQRRTRYWWVYRAALAALIPWNPLLLLALPWTIQVARILKRPDVKRAFGVEATDGITSASHPDRARISLFILLAILIGYVGSELLGITHGVVRTIDNFNRQGRIELSSLGGNVMVRGPAQRSLQTEILAQGLGSPDRTRTFSTPLYPGKYEVQFYSDEHTMSGLKEIEIVRGGIVRVHAPRDIEQVDLAQSGPVVTGSGIPFELRQIDPVLGIMLALLICLAIASLKHIWPWPTGRNEVARYDSTANNSQPSAQRRATEILTLIGFLDLFLIPVFFLWIAPVLTASGSSAPLAGIVCMFLSPTFGLMLLILTLVGRRFHVAQRTLSRESGLFASLLVLLPVGPIHILALPVSIWVLRVFYRAEQTGDSLRSSILESSGQTVEPLAKSASNWPLVYMAAVGVLIVLAGSEIDSNLLSRAWLNMTGRGQIKLNLANAQTEVYRVNSTTRGPVRTQVQAVMRVPAGGYQIEWRNVTGTMVSNQEWLVSPGLRLSVSIPETAAIVEVRGPYVGAFPVLADEPPTREEITAEVSAKSSETPRPQIANPTAVTSAELLTSNQQWKDLLSKASSIPLNEWNTLAGDIKGPNAVAVRGEPLSLVLLNLDPFAEQKQNEHVIRDFWYLTETLPKPQELANAISVSQKEGYVSFLQPERMTNLTFEEADGTVEGSVGFSVPKLYSGRVEFMARRYDDNIWRIDEFRLPNYDITLRRNTQNLWQKVRTTRNSGNRSEGSRSSP